MAKKSSSKKIRYAVVGLGDIAQEAVLPAFSHSKKSECVALVSSTPKKLKELGRRYKVDQLYSYDQYDECLTSGEIDAVFIALPNNMHADFTIRAARAGIHVLCEKPMATTSQACEAMIEAAHTNKVKLMIAYRLHLEKANLEAIKLLKTGKIGRPMFLQSSFGFLPKEGNIRLDSSLGGGPLLDIGVYPINAARYLFQAEPVRVVAYGMHTGRKRLRDVHETVCFMLEFPGQRIAQITCSFGTPPIQLLEVTGTKGQLKLNNAFEWEGGKELELTVGEKTKKKSYAEVDQFAAELEYFSECVLKNRNPEPSGLEGLADLRIIEAIEQSLKTGSSVTLEPFELGARPGPEQVVTIKPRKKPPRKLVEAEAPIDENPEKAA